MYQHMYEGNHLLLGFPSISNLGSSTHYVSKKLSKALQHAQCNYNLREMSGFDLNSIRGTSYVCLLQLIYECYIDKHGDAIQHKILKINFSIIWTQECKTKNQNKKTKNRRTYVSMSLVLRAIDLLLSRKVPCFLR